MNAKKYEVRWTRPYQGYGENTTASADYDRLRDARRKAADIAAEAETWQSGGHPRIYRDKRRIDRSGRII